MRNMEMVQIRGMVLSTLMGVNMLKRGVPKGKQHRYIQQQCKRRSQVELYPDSCQPTRVTERVRPSLQDEPDTRPRQTKYSPDRFRILPVAEEQICCPSVGTSVMMDQERGSIIKKHQDIGVLPHVLDSRYVPDSAMDRWPYPPISRIRIHRLEVAHYGC